MALIRCSECDKKISDMAASCPGCGFPIAMLPASSQTQNGNTPVDSMSKSSPAVIDDKTSFTKTRVGKASLFASAILVLVVAILAIVIVFRGSSRDLDHISLREAATGITVSLGMTRSDVEMRLGSPRASAYGSYIFRNGVMVSFAEFEDEVIDISVFDSISNREFEIAGFHANALTSRIPSAFTASEGHVRRTYRRMFDDSGNTTNSILEAFVISHISVQSADEVLISLTQQRREIRDVIHNGVRLGVARGWSSTEREGVMVVTNITDADMPTIILQGGNWRTAIPRTFTPFHAQRNRLIDVVYSLEGVEVLSFVNLDNYNFAHYVVAAKYLPSGSETATTRIVFTIDNKENEMLVFSEIRDGYPEDLATLIGFVQRIHFLD